MRSALPAFLLASLLARPAAAATFHVDRSDDSATASACTDVMPNDCSLRGAILAANGSAGMDTVVLPAGTYDLTIKGAGEDMAVTGDLDITEDVTLQGDGSATTIIDGSQLGDAMHPPDRIFHIDPAGSGTLQVTISGVTIRKGATAVIPGVSAVGGGILNGSGCNPCSAVGSAVMLSDVVLQGNSSASGGGGIGNYGAMTIVGSVISGNSTDNVGGGIAQGDVGSLEMHDTTVSGNAATSDGGGVVSGFLGSSSTVPAVTIAGCTFADNTAHRGAGLFRTGGAVTIANSTFSHNSADNTGTSGGAIHAANGGVAANNVTIAFNTGAGGGGGVYGAVTLGNTILAGNSAPTGPDCNGSITSTGHNLIQVPCTIGGDATGNLIGQVPALGALANYGGPTQTHALLPGSPGLDAADPGVPGSGGGACEATDQRGTTRPQPGGGRCDMGAFELIPGEITTTTTTTTTLPPTSSTRATSTTTQPTAGCSTQPAGPRFVSIDCRLAALVTRVNGATDVGALRTKLIGQLTQVTENEARAERLCRQASRRRAVHALGPAIEKLMRFRRTLQSRRAGSPPPALATELVTAAGAVRADMRALRHALHCPDDAPPGP